MVSKTLVGAGIGAVIAVIGTAWTRTTDDISPISIIPTGILALIGAGSLMQDPKVELAADAAFYSGVCASIGLLLEKAL